jgi:surfactin synthase thioesterase subunit
MDFVTLRKLTGSQSSNDRRLVIFHHAGGSSNQYLNLLKPWSSDFEIYAMDLPGRAFRGGETPLLDFSELIEMMALELESLSVAKNYFFGHSMGALIAYHLALKIEKSSRGKVMRLGLSGFQGPGAKNSLRSLKLSQLSDLEFSHEIGKISPWPEVALQNREVQKLFLQAARNDFQLMESCIDETALRRLSCRGSIFGAEADPLVPVISLKSWQNYFEGPVSENIYPGGHFYLFSIFDRVMNDFLAEL